MTAQSLLAEILEWRGDVALGCARSIFRDNTAARWPSVFQSVCPISVLIS
jgi:hypothetical protein